MTKLTYTAEHNGQTFTKQSSRPITHFVISRHPQRQLDAGARDFIFVSCCGRPDLAVKMAASDARLGRREIHILPAREVQS